MCKLLVFFCAIVTVFGQNPANIPTSTESNLPLHNGLTERIGNFSIELLYHTSKSLKPGENLILSPITVWTVLAVISEGAAGNTAKQINKVLRVSKNHRNATRYGFQSIYQWLQVNTNTGELAKVNAILLDQRKNLERDFQSLAETVYKTIVVPLDFLNPENTANTANTINEAISKVTHGRIPKLVESSYFGETQMLLTSALYFKGQWTVPFNKSSTTKMPFYDSSGQIIGEVNMMNKRFPYPFSNIKKLQARVIELSYGKENRLSMLIMVPNKGVSLENMFFNFAKVPLDTVFKEIRVSNEEFGDDEVDCFIPRFKIESNLDLTNVLRDKFGIYDLFDQNYARLPFMARLPVYVAKVVHKAEIEVTEEGITASGVTLTEFSNRISTVNFVANRPFCYLIIEKVTNSIVFGGVYETPSLY